MHGAAQEESSDSDYDDDDDDDEDSVSGSDDGYSTDSGSDGEGDEVMGVHDAMEAVDDPQGRGMRKKSATRKPRNVFQEVWGKVGRKRRSDRFDSKYVQEFCHNHPCGGRLDTHMLRQGSVLVKQPDGTFAYEERRVQQESASSAGAPQVFLVHATTLDALREYEQLQRALGE
jgi:hypothetical protein